MSTVLTGWLLLIAKTGKINKRRSSADGSARYMSRSAVIVLSSIRKGEKSGIRESALWRVNNAEQEKELAARTRAKASD